MDSLPALVSGVGLDLRYPN